MEQPKGIEVVKEGIRKLRFSQQLRKAEGQRTPKVELTVSVDGVAIQEPKGKVIEALFFNSIMPTLYRNTYMYFFPL